MRRLVGALALALLRALPAAAAAGATAAPGATDRAFAVQTVERDGNAVRLNLTNVRYPVTSVAVSLYADSVLVSLPEWTKFSWDYRETAEVDLRLVKDVSEVTLRLQYTRGDGNSYTQDVSLVLPASKSGERRLGVMDASVDGALVANVTLASLGTLPVGRARVSIEDGQGAKLGTPVYREVDGVAADGSAVVSFALARDATDATVVVEYENRTESTKVKLRPLEADRGARRVAVLDATDDGAGAVTVTLANVGRRAVGAVRVAVADLQGVRVGVPFERQLAALAAGETARVAFALARDVDEVAVELVYENRTETTKVRLRVADDPASGGAPGASRMDLLTELPSREAAPGSSVDYAFTLKNEGRQRLATLRVEGLPDGYSARFYVGGNAASSVQIPAGEARAVKLTIGVPAAASRDVGRSLAFAVVADVDGAEASRVALDLALRGQGRLEIDGRNWYVSAPPRGETTVNVTVKNTGSGPLYGVALAATKPTGWQASFEPASIDRLDPGESRTVALRVAAPADAGTGRYVVDVTAATSDLSARPRSLSVEVEAPAGSKLGWIAGAALAALAGVVVIVKVKRR